MKKILLVLSSALMFGMVGCAQMPQPTAQEIQGANYGSTPNLGDYKQVIKDSIGASLIDPYSAVYKFYDALAKGYQVFWSRSDKDWKVMYGYCGFVEVNAKNRFGAYVGEKLYSFIINDKNVLTYTSSSGIVQQPCVLVEATRK